jgi:hypothetical protein
MGLCVTDISIAVATAPAVRALNAALEPVEASRVRERGMLPKTGLQAFPASDITRFLRRVKAEGREREDLACRGGVLYAARKERGRKKIYSAMGREALR